MKYFKVGNRVDSLRLYAAASKPDAAVKLVEDLTGPIAPQQLVCAEIRKDQIPEGENILGEEESAETEDDI